MKEDGIDGGEMNRYSRLARIGDRVKLTEYADRYPDFMVAPGATGTVSDITDDSIWVTMDQHIPGAEEWNNAIQFYEPDDPEFGNDFARQTALVI